MFFDISNDKGTLAVSVKPETLTIKVFRDIFDRDKSKNKDDAFSDFSYIYHMCDYNSPYSNYSEDERGTRIQEEVIGDKKYKPDSLIDEACKIYRELTQTPIIRMYEVTKSKVTEIVDFISEVEVNEDNIKTIQTMIKDFTTFASSYKELEALVRKEREGIKEKIRGNKSVNTRYSE